MRCLRTRVETGETVEEIVAVPDSGKDLVKHVAIALYLPL